MKTFFVPPTNHSDVDADWNAGELGEGGGGR